MSNQAFSRGPWKIRTVKATTLLNSPFLAVWPDSYEKGQPVQPVCLIAPMSSVIEKDEANARLISAAPELLAALIGLLPENQDPVLEAEGTTSLFAIERARLAIAKATKVGDLEDY